MIEAIAFLVGLSLGHIISTYVSGRRKFTVNIDKEQGTATIEQENRPKQKVEFITEANQKEVEDEERPKGLSKFFSGFKTKKEEPEEEDEE